MLLRSEPTSAEVALQRARDRPAPARWTAFLACPEALAAEVWVRTGKLDDASETFEHAFALACQVNDACWEAYSVRGLGLLHAARGDLDGSVELMEDALTRCARQRDTHLWLRAYVLDALCAVATHGRTPPAGPWITDLASLADRSGMRELSVRAYLYRRDLGDRAVDTARVLAVGIENPHLHALIDPDDAPLPTTSSAGSTLRRRGSDAPDRLRPVAFDVGSDVEGSHPRLGLDDVVGRNRCGTSQHTSNSKPSGSLP